MNYRFAYLDGLRGIAAIFVLIRHSQSLWGFSFYRSYLAVDLFFILSGFVIAYAYNRKLETGEYSFSDFMRVRLIRLYPVFLLSVVVSTLWLLISFWGTTHKHPGWEAITLTFVLNALILPSPFLGHHFLFAINPPYWSLFFELVVNGCYALFKPLLNNKMLWLLLGGTSALLVAAALHQGDLNLGFTWELFPLATGLSRATFGIVCGILLYQKLPLLEQKLAHPALPWLSIALVMAVLSSSDLGTLNPLADIVSVLVIFPCCLLFAAKRSTSRFNPVLLGLGAASYPLYVLHSPLVEIVGRVFQNADKTPVPGIALVFTISLVLVCVWIEKRLDEPLRKKLTAYWPIKAAAKPAKLEQRSG